MKNFIDSKIFNYSLSKSSKEPKILNDLNRETHLKILNPRMLSGHYQGRILSLVSKIIKPKTVLEIGTYTGYSTICLSEGLDKNGSIHTIDHNEELLVIQNKYFKKAGISEKVKQYTGDATKIIKKLNLDFDLVFIDADKENYPLYFDLIIEKVKPGGVIIADNILWSGKILEKVEEEDYATKSIIEFNDKVNNDDRVETIILPIRDGLSLIRKI
ncbi:MAG: methyltransferase [Flavobacteriaceae bacterium]|jgi:caffeoyl-CoA O-methyltransferase|nr:methyltransferase [Flavobacteriaceae bacterium]|tara:strand:+ start:2538 stop:3182 length:645 start_codon:yes stop_codon:yes gene_type:complete